MAVKHFGTNGELIGYSYGDNVVRPYVAPTQSEIDAEQAALKARKLCGECTMPLRTDGTCFWCADDSDDEIEVD